MGKKISLIILLGVLLCGYSTPVESNSTAFEVTSEPKQENPGQMLPIKAIALMGGEKIELEVTQTPQQQALGLMFRQDLPDNRGMLFSFAPPRPVSFWMKNVAIPLDMVFLFGGEIKAIAADVPPCTVTPCPTYGPQNILIDQVIELRGGRAIELGLAVGDKVTIEFLEPTD
ncbi:MAG: DUF192 domain-containing protein [Gomphosphaeria aponina SAG 52.96 = DSM 107014]|uniref:DUF192 domain-containing protein n=1 Tax=Gomphosphaeria aponina SAG 52.96 = DSM 107014 TaxID=1521640 RepID=A0A941JMA1_9CHRO|nr:DUF192 domain-containing protein [Gomphosphaeria aponina SAG 52.96 = DSM 107014]